VTFPLLLNVFCAITVLVNLAYLYHFHKHWQQSADQRPNDQDEWMAELNQHLREIHYLLEQGPNQNHAPNTSHEWEKLLESHHARLSQLISEALDKLPQRATSGGSGKTSHLLSLPEPVEAAIRAGKSAKEIAHECALPIGEVELLLKLAQFRQNPS
jgi:hypothetical protein